MVESSLSQPVYVTDSEAAGVPVIMDSDGGLEGTCNPTCVCVSGGWTSSSLLNKTPYPEPYSNQSKAQLQPELRPPSIAGT